GEEVVTDRFPELHEAATRLPVGTVIEGEILAWKDGVLPFAMLKSRLGKRKLSKKMLDDIPVTFVAFDLLEESGQDLRALPLGARRARLEALVRELPFFRLSPRLDVADWETLA